MRRLLRLLPLAVCLAVACGDDGGSDPDGSVDVPCESDSECDDGLYCNGSESCVEGACAPGSAPCPGECDEATMTCGGECADADGDGFEDIRCGGTDCDDGDGERYPGNTEICDSLGHDEDCDPTTLGPDEDGDGYPSDECCQEEDDGDLVCGLDCDDTRDGVSPEAVDSCGNGDEDCDGDIDENPNETYYRDRDGDDFGVADDSIIACSAPDGYAVQPTDCDDTRSSINPGVAEMCDGTTDENCNSEVDEGCACTPEGTTRECGSATARSGMGLCRPGTQVCTASGWTAACSGVVEPTPEDCDDDPGQDEDCDGTIDEGCECLSGTTRRCGMDVGACSSVLQTCSGGIWPRDCADEPGVVSPGTESCAAGLADEDCDGAVDEGCSCTDGSTQNCGDTNEGRCEYGTQTCSAGAWGSCSGAVGPIAETCNGVDEDCDGVPDNADTDIPGVGGSCGTNTGECTAGNTVCNGSSLVCGGSYVGPTSESCDHLNDDCDGRTDEGTWAPTCSFWQMPGSGLRTRIDTRLGNTYWASGTNRYRLGADNTPGMLFVDDNGTLMDWGSSTGISADLEFSGATVSGYFGVVITPKQAVGTNGNYGLPVTDSGTYGYAAIYFVAARYVRLYELTPGGPVQRGQSSQLPSACTSDGPNRQILISLRNNYGQLTASAEGTSCGGSVSTTYNDSDWLDTLYVRGPGSARYQMAVVGGDGMVDLYLEGLSATRTRPPSGTFAGDYGHCTSCQW